MLFRSLNALQSPKNVHSGHTLNALPTKSSCLSNLNANLSKEIAMRTALLALWVLMCLESAAQAQVATYYGKEFAGQRTASGEKFNPGAMTAAHRTLPFGTRVRVTNSHNGRSVIVRINDRGPFVKGRSIDLSSGAARAIGMGSAANVRIEVLR